MNTEQAVAVTGDVARASARGLSTAARAGSPRRDRGMPKPSSARGR
ncbi:hypothetical protein [Streptomyces sp. H27-S2]|nr:hypothetical protein [Streptomyces sp. H27-S2]MCY0950507.1 hypothetical protein [Streptomyces sp. H27-S2]